ncbi:Rossman fold protein, TIGR00730 family [Hahella sp. CCB-MM4]|uniref:LOG family protein n=1 Tax=Hahella sp. (strain CCB-MM4) TaxID=1926491 RepID=UPI000B9AD01F|nr:TIGR00730 family Rossman fold protein [Hahella sp. CCB-MM4]OZG72849.1 Rossman fold protein, TIGR00730 family [Hahella sp. CCB-MM4]
MKVAVFCGSGHGRLPVYAEQAVRLGTLLAERDMELVFGGGHVGLMGTVADAVLAAGGRVTGVIPTALKDREIVHTGLTQLHVVKDMHERKAMMSSLADAFVAMPGGAGTMEEIFEAWTWAMLGYHQKPCAFLNVNGYYNKLIDFIQHMVSESFVRQSYKDMLIVEDNPLTLLQSLEAYEPPPSKWG